MFKFTLNEYSLNADHVSCQPVVGKSQSRFDLNRDLTVISDSI